VRGAAAAILLAILTSSFAEAEALSLSESAAVARAVQQNLTLSASRVQLEAKQLASDKSWGVFIPGMSVSTGLSRANQEINVLPPGTAYSLSSSAQLSASLSLSAATFENVRTARLEYQAGRISFEQAADTITLQVRKAFYQLILLQKQMVVTQASIATAEQTLERIRIDYSNGRVQQLTVRQAELSAQSARLVLERQRVQRENALASFKTLLAIDSATTLSLEGSIEVIPISTSTISSTANIAERSDLRGISAQIALQESKNRAAYLSMVSPTVTLSASVSPSFPDPFHFDNPPGSGWNDRGSVSLSLSSSSLLGFLPFVPQRVNLEILNKGLESLRIQKQAISAEAITEIESLVRSLETSTAAISSLRASVALTQESYDLTREAYGLGTADFLTLKSAEDDLLKAQYEVLSEEYNYLTTVINLEYATGLDLRGRKE
jgi:outer membrane protein TolC